MNAVGVGALATLGLFLVAGGQLLYAARQAHREQVLMVVELGDRWKGLRRSWDLLLLVSRGPGDYYINTSLEEVQAYAAIVSEDEELDARTEDSAERYENLVYRVRPYEMAVQDVGRFLSQIGFLILNGQLRPELAYAILGTEVVRNSRAIRVLTDTHAPPLGWKGQIDCKEVGDRQPPPGERFRQNLRNWFDYHPGIRRRLLIVLDILWAEAARLEDLERYDLALAATIKERCRTGERNRKRLMKEAVKLGHRLRGRRLARRLLHAEFQSQFARGGVPRNLRGEESFVQVSPQYPASNGSRSAYLSRKEAQARLSAVLLIAIALIVAASWSD